MQSARNSAGLCVLSFQEMAEVSDDVNGSDEAALIRKIVEGQRELFGDLIAPHLSLLSRMIRPIVGGQPEIDDIVQQTALKALINLAQFRFEAGFSTWLIQIGINEARQWRRKYASSPVSEFTPSMLPEAPAPHQSDSPLTEYEKSETRAHIRAALARLPEKYRSVLLLRDFEDLTIRDVAERLGLSIAAVKSRHLRARKKIAGVLGRSRWFRMPVLASGGQGPQPD